MIYSCKINDFYIGLKHIYITVVNQHYDVQVYHTHVLAGNTAVLSCAIPSFVKEYVTVTSWARDDSTLLPGSNMGKYLINLLLILDMRGWDFVFHGNPTVRGFCTYQLSRGQW